MYINDHRVRTNRQLYKGGRGIAGFGDTAGFPGLTCARTAPQIDNPAITECIDASGNVLGTMPTASAAGAGVASPSGTLFGYDQNTVLVAAAAGLALFILFKKK